MIPLSQVSLSPKNRGYNGRSVKKKPDLAKFGQIWPFLWWHYDKDMHFRKKKRITYINVSMSKWGRGLWKGWSNYERSLEFWYFQAFKWTQKRTMTPMPTEIDENMFFTP